MADNSVDNQHTSAIILAAGRGTRLNSPPDQNKVTYALADKPMISYTVDHLHLAGVKDIIVVVGHAKESVIHALKDSVTYVQQTKLLGTGHAVKTALPQLTSSAQNLIVLYGDDSAFYPPQLFKQLLHTHQQQHAVITVLTIEVDDPTGLGRIIRQNEDIIGIVEEKNATASQKKIKEINTGLYCFDANYLKNNIHRIQKNPVSGEFYLTDIIQISRQDDQSIVTLKWPDSSVWCGVNTPDQLKLARQRIKQLSS